MSKLQGRGIFLYDLRRALNKLIVFQRKKSSVLYVRGKHADRSEQTSQKGFHTRGTECACAQ